MREWNSDYIQIYGYETEHSVCQCACVCVCVQVRDQGSVCIV